MTTNEIKKGMKIRLKCGWDAIMMDNLKGNTRMAEVDGIVKEIGSIYAHDIAWVEIDGKIIEPELTEKQKDLAKCVDAMNW